MSEAEDRKRLRRYRRSRAFPACWVVSGWTLLAFGLALWIALGPFLGLPPTLFALLVIASGWPVRHAPRAFWRAKADLQAGAGLIVRGEVSRRRGRWLVGDQDVVLLRADRHWLKPGAQVEARCGLASRLVLEVTPL